MQLAKMGGAKNMMSMMKSMSANMDMFKGMMGQLRVCWKCSREVQTNRNDEFWKE